MKKNHGVFVHKQDKMKSLVMVRELHRKGSNYSIKQNKSSVPKLVFVKLICNLQICSSTERTATIILKSGTWELKGPTKGSQKGECPLRLGTEYAIHMLLKCLETKC